MDRIVFYSGDETGYVVEKDNYKNSFFSEQYTSALKLFKSIYSSRGPVSNIIAFCGDRGEGKTSCMRSFMELLKNETALKTFEPDWSFNVDDIKILDVIDPAFFDKKHNLIELVLGQMYGEITKNVEQDEEYSAKLNQEYDLLKDFQTAKTHLAHLEKEKRELYDPLEELSSLSAGINLEKCLDKLIAAYLKFQNKKKLVLAIDDLDLNMTEGYRMAEQIRKYLNHKSCILLISLKVGQLTEVIANSIAKEVGTSKWESDDLIAMASKYVVKLIPYGNRVLMPSINDLCDVKLQICNRGDALKNPKDLNCVKDEVTRLIFMKTRYLFYNEKGSVSPIVPKNLRSLRLLLGMLLQMEDFESNESHSANKKIFKSYLFDEWTKCLDADDQRFVCGLLDYQDLSGINKYVISHFENSSYRSFVDVSVKETSEYDVSLGQVFRTLSYVGNINTDNEIKKLIFFLRSYYSMKLYELYDVISETEGGLYPLDSSAEEEVVKVDTIFKHVNQLQKLLNGAYFRYAPDELLAPQRVGGTRDLHAINGAKLNELLKVVSGQMEQFADVHYEKDDASDEAKKWSAFKKDFRMCEFFILTTTRSITSKEKDAKKFFDSPNASVPAYMTEYNPNMGYYLFDVMAPFYNIVNIKYAYMKFADIGDIYEYALKHEWSLLRQMMRCAFNNRKDKKILLESEHMDVAIHCLASDAIIRNADVHSAILETMQTNRYKIKETGSTSGLLEKTYSALTKIGMKTYSYSEGKAHEIHFVFLSAIIEFLSEMDDDDEKVFDSIFYVNSVNDAVDLTNLSPEESSWLDNTYSFLAFSHYPLKGNTVIDKLQRNLSPEVKQNLKRGIFQKQINKNKSYSSWDEVKSSLAAIVPQLSEAVSSNGNDEEQ